MVTFDSPSREFCQLRRIRTNTPLQALVTLNDPVYVEASRRLAAWMQEREKTTERRVSAGYRRIMGRELSPAKTEVLVKLFQETESYYLKHPKEAGELLDSKIKGVPQLAALTVVANTILNLDEVVMKE